MGLWTWRVVALGITATCGGAAFHFHQTLNNLPEIAHPANDPRYASLATQQALSHYRSPLSAVLNDIEPSALEVQYQAAIERYGAQINNQSYEMSRLEDNQQIALGVFYTFLYLTVILFLPWIKVRKFIDDAGPNVGLDLARFSKSAALSIRNRRGDSGPSIVGRDGLTSYSVADEVSKWHQLYRDGLVTESEFIAAKQKLLNRPE